MRKKVLVGFPPSFTSEIPKKLGENLGDNCWEIGDFEAPETPKQYDRTCTPPRRSFITNQTPKEDFIHSPTPPAPKRNHGNQNLRSAVLHHDREAIRKLLDNLSTDPNQKLNFPSDTSSFFCLAPRSSRIKDEFLQDQIDFETSEATLPLLYAAKHSTPAVVEELLAGGSLPNGVNSRNQNALHVLCLQDFRSEPPADLITSIDNLSPDVADRIAFFTAEHLDVFRTSKLKNVDKNNFLNNLETIEEVTTTATLMMSPTRVSSEAGEDEDENKDENVIKINEEDSQAIEDSSDRMLPPLPIKTRFVAESPNKSEEELREDELVMTTKLLIRAGLLVDHKDIFGNSPIYYALKFKHFSVAQELRMAGGAERRSEFDGLFNEEFETEEEVNEEYYNRCETPPTRKRIRDRFELSFSPESNENDFCSTPVIRPDLLQSPSTNKIAKKKSDEESDTQFIVDFLTPCRKKMLERKHHKLPQQTTLEMPTKAKEEKRLKLFG
eukprot:GHVP01000538.1.p1 GENE.GHVP01000538.1~~GHVP01000538.1.p1  ORF type:complete len:496 (-),score=107.43 GHVP01000538.1:198-1685(-)